MLVCPLAWKRPGIELLRRSTADNIVENGCALLNEVEIRVPEHRVVEEVEGFQTELDPGLLTEVLTAVEGQVPVLADGEVHISYARTGTNTGAGIRISAEGETAPAKGLLIQPIDPATA